MPGFTFARVPGGVVASLLDHRLHAGKPPASWQMDAEVTWDVATRAHAAVAHPLRRRVGTQPAATRPLGDREPPSSLRADLGRRSPGRPRSCRVSSIAGVGFLEEGPGTRREDGAYPQQSVTDEPRGPGAFLEQPEGPQLFSRPTSWLAPRRPPRVCSSLAPRWTRKSLAAKHQPLVRYNTTGA